MTPPLREVQVRVVVVDAFMHLPEVEAVGVQPPQRLFELAHRLALAASVRAHLGHQEDAVAPIAYRLAHHHFRTAVVVLPRVVHEA